jgi:hypothetical protein
MAHFKLSTMWPARRCNACFTMSGRKFNSCLGKTLHSLCEWMDSMQTDSDIPDTLLAALRSWRQGETTSDHTDESLQHAIAIQSALGWHSFLEGWIAIEWETVQQDYCTSIRSRRTGFWWLVLLIRKLWWITCELCSHKNSILHDNTNLHEKETSVQMDRDITQMYNKARCML